ncbi:unnamed protein product, partial [Polarella glacialis]
APVVVRAEVASPTVFVLHIDGECSDETYEAIISELESASEEDASQDDENADTASVRSQLSDASHCSLDAY